MKNKEGKNRYSGFYKIFQFTFQQRVKARGYRSAVIIGALLCLLVPMAIMACVELFGGEGEIPPNPVTTVLVAETASQEEAPDGEAAGTAAGEEADYNQLNGLGREGYTDISYQRYDTPQEALEAARGMEDTVVLAVERAAGGDQISLVLPEDSNLTKSDLEGLESFIGSVYPYIQMQRTGLTSQELTRLTAPVAVETHRIAGSAAVD